MDIQKKILEALDEPIYDLAFLFSKEALDAAPEILDMLLEEEKKEFQANLLKNDEELDFSIFHKWSKLDVYYGLLDHHKNVDSNDTIRKISEDFEPKLVDFWNEVAYSKRFFDQMNYFVENKQPNTEEKRILTESIKSFKIRGIDLPQEKQERVKAINKELSDLGQKFGNNALDAENEFSYHMLDESMLSEMPEDEKQVARKKAQDKGLEGYIFDASRSGYSSIMTYCSSGEIRKLFYDTKNAFASFGKYDNREIILHMLQLKEEKSHLMGYKNYAEYSLETKMAKSPEEVTTLILSVFEKGKQKALKELEEIKTFFHKDEIGYPDFAYYTRKYKEEKFKFDVKILKNYFEFEKVLSWMFTVAKKLYDLEFIEIQDVSKVKYTEDIRFYEVRKDGELISYFLWDFFYRTGKRAGAWANNLSKKHLEEDTIKTPLVINVCNFQKNDIGPTLLTFYDVETIFHEFGHALHEITARSNYAELSGFGVEWDFVELPSQIMENWCNEKQSLDLFAHHKETGEVIPQDIFDTMKSIEKFGKWFFLLRQWEFGYLDMTLHTDEVPKTVEDLDAKVREITKKMSLFPRDEKYKQYCSFHHIFDGGYAAGYYSYMWAEIIEAQVFAEFEKHGIFNQKVAKEFHDKILAKWCEQDAIELFTDFLPEWIKLDAFLERYGIG